MPCNNIPHQSEEHFHITSKISYGKLVESPLGDTKLNCVVRRLCIRGSGDEARNDRESRETLELRKHKYEIGGQDLNQLHRLTRKKALRTVVSHRLNGT